MKGYYLKKVLSSIFVLFIIITLNFFLPRMIFSDPAQPYFAGVPEDDVPVQAANDVTVSSAASDNVISCFALFFIVFYSPSSKKFNYCICLILPILMYKPVEIVAVVELLYPH